MLLKGSVAGLAESRTGKAKRRGLTLAVIRNDTQWVSVLMQGVSRFLDRTGNEDRAAIKLHAKAAEFVYEDEYDDSYDDLGGGGADGIADVEGAILSTYHVGPVLYRRPLLTLRHHRHPAFEGMHAVWD